MLDNATYRKKVLGCWLGKSVGGTLGGPVEGHPGPMHLSFYDPVPTTMIPNDDLDLQVVWACTVNNRADKRVNSQILGQAWLDCVGFPWDEYGVAIRNLKNGVWPPFTGSYDNYFTDGMGCAIRSELWACLAPGNPALAAKLAYEDACVDHAGSGLYAEVFLAAMEAAAFEESDIRKIVEIGLSFIPQDCPLRQSIVDAIQWFDEKPDFDYLFKKIIGKYQTDNFTDVKVNMPIIVAGMLLGKGDFSATICNAVNFGEDADCTGATTGALMGILNPDGIGDEWLKPIGRSLVLSRQIHGFTPPPTIDDFSDMVCELSKTIRLDPQPAKSYKPVTVKGLAVTRPVGSVQQPSEPVSFDGYWWTWPTDLPADKELALRFNFTIEADGKYIVMVNSVSENASFVDGVKVLEREAGGRMVPSFHRCPQHQRIAMELKAGKHTLDIVLRNQPAGRKLSWVMGVATASDAQWIPDAFLK